jgi:hypothetical protein
MSASHPALEPVELQEKLGVRLRNQCEAVACALLGWASRSSAPEGMALGRLVTRGG